MNLATPSAILLAGGLAAVAGTGLALAAVTATASVATAQDEAVTRPSKDAVLAFVMPGMVAEVLVKEGDAVEANQVIMRQDDSVEQAQMVQLKAQAEDTVRIEAQQAQLEQRRVDLQKVEQAHRAAGGDGSIDRADGVAVFHEALTAPDEPADLVDALDDGLGGALADDAAV